MFYKQNENRPDEEKAQEVLGDDLHFDLMEIESETLLGKTLF